MSPLALLGATATALSTITLLPHLVQALRAGRPGGSTVGWSLGFLASRRPTGVGLVHVLPDLLPGEDLAAAW